MRLKLLSPCLTLLGIFSLVHSYGQNSATKPAGQLQKIYEQFSPNVILSGQLYLERYLAKTGHAMHKDSNFNSESLTYDGIYYSGVKLSYDTFLDEVVVFLSTENASSRIMIDKTRASSFTIAGDQFVYFEDSIAGDGPFQVLHQSESVLLFAKRTTVKKADYNNRYRNRNSLDPADQIYIKNDAGTHLVKKKKEVLRAMENDPVFQDYKKRKKKIALYRGTFEPQLITLLSQYENE